MQSKCVAGEDRKLSGQASGTALVPIAASFCFLLELGFTPLCLPMIQDEFSLTRSEVAQVVSLFLLVTAVFIIPFGILSRYISVEAIFIAGLITFSVGSLEFILSSSKAWLLASRCVQGFGAAMFAPMIPVMLMSINRSRGGFLLAVWASYSGLVSAIAPFAAGIILAYGSWRAAHVIIFVVALISMLAYTSHWKAAHHTQSKAQVLSISILASRKNVLILIYVFLTYAMTTFLIVYGSIELDEDGWLLTRIGVVMTVMWVTFSVTSVVIRNLLNETGISRLLFIGAFLDFVGLLLVLERPAEACVYLGFALAGAGMALNNAPTTALLLGPDDSAGDGILSSLDIAVARLGGALSVLLLAPMGNTEILAAMVAMTAVGMLCSIYWRPSKNRSGANPSRIESSL